jgi:hypothetical protein
VRNAWRRAGGTRTAKAGWNLLWGKPLRLPDHARLNEFQRVCHFPGTFLLGRKDSLARHVGIFRRRCAPAPRPAPLHDVAGLR